MACLSLYQCRKVRKRDATKLHIQLCIAIFLMLLIFLVGIERTETEVGCTIMSLLIQYFTLASVTWMGAEAIFMFQKLIIVFGRTSSRHLLIISIICWCTLKHSIILLFMRKSGAFCDFVAC